MADDAMRDNFSDEDYVFPPEPEGDDAPPPSEDYDESSSGRHSRGVQTSHASGHATQFSDRRDAGGPGNSPTSRRSLHSHDSREHRPANAEFRPMPSSPEAEQCVLGAMLVNPNTVIDILEELAPEDFYRPAHQTIYQGILDLFADNKEIDALLLGQHLERYNNLERVGGMPYLHTLMSSVQTTANAPYYAEIVAEKAQLRRLVDAGTHVVQLGYEGSEGAEVDALIDMAQQEIYALSQRKTTEDYAILRDVLVPTMDELDRIAEFGGQAMGIQTGFPELDDITNGLHGGQMIIIAARPGVGKSTLGMDFMRHCSLRQGKASVIFSLEMSQQEIVRRLLSAETEISVQKMNAGKMDDQDWSRMVSRVSEIEDAPLFIDDSPNLTMMEIRSKARRLKQQYDLQLIVVDYLQLMSSGKKVESRQQEVSEFSRQLKLLAKELDVPLVAISQLNRGPESRTDKRPQLADLRESGSLEQDADMVFLLYRPDSQNPDDERAGEADIIIAKHRGGPIGTVGVAHQLGCSRFVPMPRMGA